MNTKDMAYISIFSIFIALCSWISIPTTIPFTLQTFGVFITCLVLGGKKGTLSILLYILLGCIGIPVFANFSSGFGVLLGSTGGYIIGFLATGLIMWFFERYSSKPWVVWLSMILGLIACYAIGTVWFMVVYAKNTGAIGLMSVLGWCVFPFIIPDFIKIVLAKVLANRLEKVVKR
ncbi:MAG: biotin transporter BioY [Bacillota bacterium]|nr:biotin transporter BioY [Bacillota bacterium]